MTFCLLLRYKIRGTKFTDNYCINLAIAEEYRVTNILSRY